MGKAPQIRALVVIAEVGHVGQDTSCSRLFVLQAVTLWEIAKWTATRSSAVATLRVTFCLVVAVAMKIGD